MKVVFKNPKTGERKEVKVGWSWTLFLFSGFFGLPLFLRKLYVWGSICLALRAIDVVVSIISTIGGDDADVIGASAQLTILFALGGLGIWLGIKGNEMTAKNYLEQGWVVAEPASEGAKFAFGKWGISPDQKKALAG
jgi:hypothetical protein